jgi:hypothetical protein
MLPQNQIPNSLGLSQSQSANMLGTLGDSVNAAMPPEEQSEQAPANNIVLTQFSSAWNILKGLNANGGDADKFRALQKALEDWFSDIAQQAPDSSASQTTGY